MDTDVLKRLIEQAGLIFRAKAGREQAVDGYRGRRSRTRAFAPACQAAMG
jgi:hypothetical protein